MIQGKRQYRAKIAGVWLLLVHAAACSDRGAVRQQPNMPLPAQAVYDGKTATGRGRLIYLDFERGQGVRYAPLSNYGCVTFAGIRWGASLGSLPSAEIRSALLGHSRRQE